MRRVRERTRTSAPAQSRESAIYDRIVVPIDTPAASRAAVRWAATLARRSGCELELVHVALPPIEGVELGVVSGKIDEDNAAHDRETEAGIRALVSELAALDVAANPVILRGPVETTLNDHARESRADLIVMTKHDRGRLERLLLGSISDRVAQHSGVPALILHADETPMALSTPAEVSRILIPLDGSDFAEAVLPHAERLARIFRARVTLLGVVQPMLAATALAGGLGGTMEASLTARIDADELEAERTELESRALTWPAERLRETGLLVDAAVVVNGQPGRAIVDYAVTHGIGLIAMTTHGRGGLGRLIEGSVARHVLHHTSLPLMLHRPNPPERLPASAG